MGKGDAASLERTIRWMFRLDEDFTPFQARCRRTRHLTWVARYGLGAFLRNADLFEDFIKILLTTNVSWAGTRLMNCKLIEHLGRPVEPAGGFDPPLRAFPDPGDVASATESFLRRKVRVGYRAPYLIEFAGKVASGALRLEDFLDPDLSSEDLARKLSSLKGFGPYAVSALFLTLGRYDRLILDSWTRKKSAERHFKSGRATDRSLRRVYEPWGSWKTLACWFECAYDTWYKDELMTGGERIRL
jgi:3-methyladenine DNA glycosylase/8-oxoguanine DNA glycosylase